MRMLTPLRPATDGLLSGANPLARVGAAAAVMLAAFVSIDLLTPVILLCGLLAAVPLLGLRPGAIASRAWPVVVAAAFLALFNALFAAQPSGAILVTAGPLELRSGSLLQGLALGLRVVTVALAGVLALVTIDPTDLADALPQQAHVGPRLAVGALAAFRFAPILALEWQTLRLAQRARGMDAGWSPLAVVRLTVSRLFALLVGAIRRATRLALAMESRGFGSRPCRSAAREQRMESRDWALVAAAIGLAAAAVAISVAAGSWRMLFS